MSYAVLLLLVFSTVSSTTPSYRQHHNVFFHHDKSIHTSSHRWTLSFLVDFTPYFTAVNDLITFLSSTIEDFNAYGSLNVTHNDSLASTYINLLTQDSQDLQNLLHQAVDLRSSLHNSTRLCVSQCSALRPKRSLLPFVGRVLHSLFGVTTDDRTKDIASHLQNVAHRQENIIHVVNESLTLLQDTNYQAAINRKTINALIDISSTLSSKMTTFEATIRNILLPFKQATLHFLQLHAAKATLATSFLDFSKRTYTVLDQFTELLQGHVSPAFFDPGILRYTLRQVKFRLTTGLNLPYDPDSDLFQYYQLIHASVSPHSNGFLVVLAIPLTDVTSTFDVYSIRRIPMFLPLNDTYGNITATYRLPHTSFAISKDLTQVMYLQPSDLASCLHEELHFCFVTQPLYDTAFLSHDCIMALFLNRTNVYHVCETQLSTLTTDHSLATYLRPGTWAISTTKPVHFTIHCSSSDVSHVRVNPPMDIIQLPLNCHATSDVMHLPRNVHLSSSINLPPIHFNISLAHSIWKPVIDTLQSVTIPDLPTKLHTISQSSHTVSALRTALMNVNSSVLPVSPTSWPWYKISFVTVLIVLIFLLAVIITCYVTRHCPCPPKCSLHKSTTTDSSPDVPTVDITPTAPISITLPSASPERLTPQTLPDISTSFATPGGLFPIYTASSTRL